MSSVRSKRQSGKTPRPSADSGAALTPPAEKTGPDMEALRRKIDVLDEQIVKLVNERAANASKIGALKAQSGIKPYNPSREIQVYRKVAARNKGPLPNEAFRSIYREIMSATI